MPFRSDPNAKGIGLTAAFIICSFGGLVFWGAWGAWIKARQSLDWPPVKGVLLAIETHHARNGSSYRTVRYEYEFAAHVYQGDKFNFGMRSDASRCLHLNGVGGEVQVFVNPESPQESVLVPGDDGGSRIFSGIGAGLILVGIGVGLAALASSKHGILQP